MLLTATSERHARALASHIVESAKKGKQRPLGVEGLEAGQWILLDFGDVIIHVLQEQSREHYDLDGLWIEARRIPVEES